MVYNSNKGQKPKLVGNDLIYKISNDYKLPEDVVTIIRDVRNDIVHPKSTKYNFDQFDIIPNDIKFKNYLKCNLTLKILGGIEK